MARAVVLRVDGTYSYWENVTVEEVESELRKLGTEKIERDREMCFLPGENDTMVALQWLQAYDRCTLPTTPLNLWWDLLCTLGFRAGVLPTEPESCYGGFIHGDVLLFGGLYHNDETLVSLDPSIIGLLDVYVDYRAGKNGLSLEDFYRVMREAQQEGERLKKEYDQSVVVDAVVVKESVVEELDSAESMSVDSQPSVVEEESQHQVTLKEKGKSLFPNYANFPEDLCMKLRRLSMHQQEELINFLFPVSLCPFFFLFHLCKYVYNTKLGR
jgi:hypothetical protein